MFHGQVQVVFQQYILCTHPAADHAATAQRTACPLRSFPVKIGIGDCFVRLAEIDAHRYAIETVLHTRFPGCRQQHVIHSGGQVMFGPAQHPGRFFIMGRQFRLPVNARREITRLIKPFRGIQQDIGIDQGSATDTRPAENGSMAKEIHTLNTTAEQARTPEKPERIVVGWRMIRIFPPLPRFQHQYVISLLGQAQGRYTAAETGADHEKVAVKRLHIRGRNRHQVVRSP